MIFTLWLSSTAALGETSPVLWRNCHKRLNTTLTTSRHCSATSGRVVKAAWVVGLGLGFGLSLSGQAIASLSDHHLVRCELTASVAGGNTKLREAMAEEMKGRVIGGEGKVAEIDGAYFGGYVKPANLKEDRRDRRLAANQSGKRKSVIIIRERNGNSVPAVFASESAALGFIKARIAPGTLVNADEAPGWDALHAAFEMKRIDHSQAYSFDGACTNTAEEYFSRLRRAEAGHHHHIAGAYLLRYAQEASWREDNRRVSNGDQVRRLAGLALGKCTSPDFVGYWQRHI